MFRNIFMLWHLLLVLLLALLSSFALAQQKSPDELLKANDYAGYLSAALSDEKSDKTAETPNKPAKAVSFKEIVLVAMALDKTRGWQGADEQQLRAQYGEDALAGKRLDALHMLLSGDTAGAVALYTPRNEAPEFFDAMKAIKLLK